MPMDKSTPLELVITSVSNQRYGYTVMYDPEWQHSRQIVKEIFNQKVIFVEPAHFAGVTVALAVSAIETVENAPNG